jgi:hypothetical protein
VAREDRFHRHGVARHLLLVGRREGFGLNTAEQCFHFPVGELGALDSSRRAGILDGRDLAELTEPLGGQPSQCTPYSVELIDFGDGVMMSEYVINIATNVAK